MKVKKRIFILLFLIFCIFNIWSEDPAHETLWNYYNRFYDYTFSLEQIRSSDTQTYSTEVYSVLISNFILNQKMVLHLYDLTFIGAQMVNYEDLETITKFVITRCKDMIEDLDMVSANINLSIAFINSYPRQNKRLLNLAQEYLNSIKELKQYLKWILGEQ